jgi:hypothetical protein
MTGTTSSFRGQSEVQTKTDAHTSPGSHTVYHHGRRSVMAATISLPQRFFCSHHPCAP